MATRKVIQVSASGVQSEYAGKPNSVGSADSGEFVTLDGNGKIDSTMMPAGIGSDAVAATAGEAIAAGDMVYFNGTGQVLKADATSPGKAARGYVTASVATGAVATVYFDDSNSSVSGLTSGATYYLSATAGGITTAPPTTAGFIVQEVGFATSATNLRVSIQEPITRA